MSTSLDSWFTEEILPHEPSLMRLLARVWPRRDEHSDLRQETYARVYEAAQQARPLNARSFLFTTARNLMADRIRRERIVSIQAAGETDFLNVLIDELTPEERVSAAQELALLARAYDRLPKKCREVFWMRRIKSVPQKEAAARLGITQKAIERHLAIATRLLTQYMSANKLIPRNASDADTSSQHEHEDEQGTH